MGQALDGSRHETRIATIQEPSSTLRCKQYGGPSLASKVESPSPVVGILPALMGSKLAGSNAVRGLGLNVIEPEPIDFLNGQLFQGHRAYTPIRIKSEGGNSVGLIARASRGRETPEGSLPGGVDAG